MDRGLTGTLLSVMRLDHDDFNPNPGAGALDRTDRDDVKGSIEVLAKRAWGVVDALTKTLAVQGLKERIDEWARQASMGGRILAYEKKGKKRDQIVALLKRPGIQAWDDFTVPMSMREVEPGVRLIMSASRFTRDMPFWSVRPRGDNGNKGDSGRNARSQSKARATLQPVIPKLEGLGDLVDRDFRGQTVQVAIAGGGTQRVRFLADGDNPPKNDALVLVLHPSLSQSDINESGVAYGRWSLTQLQDAETGASQINFRIARPNVVTQSLRLPGEDWLTLVQVGIVSEG